MNDRGIRFGSWLAVTMASTTIFFGLASRAQTVPRPDHVIVVMEENHGYTQVIGSSKAPYINSLARQEALFTQSFALAHPSQPNYNVRAAARRSRCIGGSHY